MTDGIPRRPDGRPLWYGRRQGHKLRQSRRDLIETLLPKIRLATECAAPIDLSRAFPGKVREFRLEIGFGGGEHLAGQAAVNPDVGFVGCEPFVNGVASLLAEIDARRLENVRVFDDDARIILDRFAPGTFSRVYILFPDPWPKTRHQRRRIVGTETLGTLARIVRPGGEILFATDHMGYAAWALEAIRRHSDWQWLVRGPRDWRQPPDDWIETRYERKAKGKGLKPVYLRFVRRL